MGKRINPSLGKALHEVFLVEPSSVPISVERLGVPEAIAAIDEIMAGLGDAQKNIVVSDMARKYSGGGREPH